MVDRARGSMSLATVARNVCWKVVSEVEVDAKILLAKTMIQKISGSSFDGELELRRQIAVNLK